MRFTHLLLTTMLLVVPLSSFPEPANSSTLRISNHRISLASGASSNSQIRELRGALLDRDVRPMSGDTTIREAGFLLKLPATAPLILLDVDTSVWMIQ